MTPRAVAGAFLDRVAADYGLRPADLQSAYVVKEYQTRHNEVTHLIYKQRFQGLDVHNSDFTINVDRYGRVLNAGGFLFQGPPPGAAQPSLDAVPTAVRLAVAEVNPSLAGRFAPFQHDTADHRKAKFYRSALGDDVDAEAIWYGYEGIAHPAWRIHITDENGVDSYEVIVDSETQRVLSKEPMTWYQSAPRGMVFDRSSPQANPRPGTQLTAPPAFVNRSTQSFAGDPVASPRGWVAGNETAGNNTLTGANPSGTRFLRNPATAVATGGDFTFPLELGPGAANPMAFNRAATTNLFYWINRAHDFFYQAGFDEGAGNYQDDNFGRPGVGGDRLLAYTHFGAASTTAASVNNASYSAQRLEDGAVAALQMFLGAQRNGGFTDSAYDAEVIVHEYTHAVSLRLVRSLSGAQGGAMGEGWSDFFALEMLTPEDAPIDGVYPTGEYFFQLFGTGIRTRPYSTRMDVNPLTFALLGRVISRPEVHADGEIWMQALWELRANLIGQFGAAEGRRRTRLLIIDGMKLSPPSPSMVDMRDSILLADRVDFEGASQEQIWSAFAKRGLGALAQSHGAGTVHVAASFDQLSSAGAIGFYEPSFVIGESIQLAVADGNNAASAVRVELTGSSGDTETILLRRNGAIFSGSIGTSFTPVTRENGVLQLMTGDFISAYYVDGDTGSGAARLVQTTVPSSLQYTTSLYPADGFEFGNEQPLFSRDFLAAVPPGAVLSTTVTLPFSFPFFGGRYATATIFSYGVIAFGAVQGSVCASPAALSGGAQIAPLFADIALTGRVQSNENIYRSILGNSVTFRWAGEVRPASGMPTEPVNFAATLYDDGRIEFRYGSGNRALIKSDALCGATAPVVGVSNGHGSFSQRISSHDGQASLENARIVLLEPPFGFSSIPSGILQIPIEGQSFSRTLTGRGVVWDTDSSIARVDVLVDGVARARAAVGAPRPNFCAQQPLPGCPNVGIVFNLNFDSLNLPTGRHTMQLRATNARGAFSDFPETPVAFRVEESQIPPPVGRIEIPEAQAEVSGILQVRGWALAKETRVTAVDILIDGVTYGRAQYGQPRPDVCEDTGESPNCPGVGFAFTLNPNTSFIPLPNGRHNLQARVQDQLGRLTLIPETAVSFAVNNPVNQPPRGVLVTPQANERLSGVIRIYGYAWDPDGRVVNVSLLVDGAITTSIPYGRSRPSECEALADVTACPNIGFELDLDTRRFSNGLHSLAIQIVDDRTSVVTIPRAGRSGINIFVEN